MSSPLTSTIAPADRVRLRWSLDGIDWPALRRDAIADNETIFYLIAAASFVEATTDLYTRTLIDYFAGDDEITEWLKTHWLPEELQHGRALRRYVKPSLLLMDEFAYEPFDLPATTHLYRVVSARHGQGSIVLTANTGFSSWKSLFPSEPMAVSTVDRLVDHATILRFTGESFRTPKEVVGAPLDD